MEANAFLTERLRELDRAIEDGAKRVREDADDEALHDLRVAIRRMRVLLKLARPVFSRFYSDSVREPFTAFHRATSELRDEEVLEETFASLALNDRAFDRWLHRRKEKERELRKMVKKRVDTGELDVARKKLEALLLLPVKPKRARELGMFARQAVLKAQAEVEKLRDTPVTDAVKLHELRIAYKNLRYSAELLAAALPPDLRAVAEPSKKLQARLGDLHDVDVAIAMIVEARALPVATRTKVAKALRALRTKRVHEYLAEIGQPAPKPTPARRRKRIAAPLRGTLSRP